MKKLNYLVYLFIMMVIGVPSVFAASISVRANSTSVTVGNSVRVTVSVSGDNADAWEYCLNYDSNAFTLTSPSNPCILGGLLAGNSSVTFTLKSVSSGTSTIGVKDVQVLDAAANAVNTTRGSVSVTARTQQEIVASYSSDADLRALSIKGYELTPSFNKNTLDYSLEVENDVESVEISATRSDSGARVVGTGTKELSEGINKFEIVVTAEKGNKKTYTVIVNRKELNPITVNVDNKSYNVVRKSESLEVPTYYSATTTIIDETEVPAFSSEITGYTLVGLKDEEGNIGLYIYDNGNYRLYKQIGNEGFVFILEEVSETIEGYENKKNLIINDIEADAYYRNEEDEIVLVYGMNASSGEKSWYKYDTKEGTFQRYINEENVKSLVGDEYFYITIAFAGGLALAIIIIMILLSMLSKKDKQRKKLIEYIENKKSSKEEQTEENSKTEENKKEESIPKKAKKKKNKNEETEINPELEELNSQFLDFIEKSAQNEKVEKKEKKELKEAEVELSKRELRRLEKEQKEAEEKELQEMRDDFLSTKENEIVDDSDILEEVETNKKNKTKSKKKKRSK